MNELVANKKLLGVLPDDDVLSQCIHCGMCLATCPTYEMTKFERSSPRGRIKLIKSVAHGEMEITKTFAEEMSFCLDCQACETACPAGVKYGSMVEAARVEVAHAGYGSTIGKFIKKFALNILASNKNLKLFSRFLFFYQNFGIQKFIHSIGLIKIFSKKLSEIDKLSPKVSRKFSDKLIEEITPAENEEKYRTAFLTGCLMNVMFAEINKDTVDVLSSSGCKVISPKDQVCCGSLHAHNGDYETAKKLAKKNLDIFSKHKFDFMISNSAGCGAFMKEYGHALKDDESYSEIAKNFSSKVKDITEFLAEEKPDILNNQINEEVTYHDACHLAHTQKIIAQPREVLNSIPGLNVKPLEESTWCCGSAGIYNIVRYEDSMVVLKRKMENIKKTNAKIVLTGNPGCISQIRYGAKRFNVDVEVMHPVSLIRKGFTRLSRTIP
ncbi:MAG: (Fe-S)-binding protein [Ignavibacteriaceae bacterium]